MRMELSICLMYIPNLAWGNRNPLLLLILFFFMMTGGLHNLAQNHNHILTPACWLSSTNENLKVKSLTSHPWWYKSSENVRMKQLCFHFLHISRWFSRKLSENKCWSHLCTYNLAVTVYGTTINYYYYKKKKKNLNSYHSISKHTL